MAGRETKDKQIETLRKNTQMQNMFVCISQKNKNYFRKLEVFVLRKKSIFFLVGFWKINMWIRAMTDDSHYMGDRKNILSVYLFGLYDATIKIDFHECRPGCLLYLWNRTADNSAQQFTIIYLLFPTSGLLFYHGVNNYLQ